MNAEIVTGYIGEILNKSVLDTKTHRLLEKLYNMALEESKAPLPTATKYDELIKLPPTEFAKWIVCPDMFDDNFAKPQDCDHENCTQCCLKYLTSPAESETKTQPTEVANEKSNLPELLSEDAYDKDAIEEQKQAYTQKKVNEWLRCGNCLRQGFCTILQKIEKHINDNYTIVSKTDGSPITTCISCDMFLSSTKIAYGYSQDFRKFDGNFRDFCEACEFEKRCSQRDVVLDSEVNKFLLEICKIDDCLKILQASNCKGFSKKTTSTEKTRK